VAGNPERRNYYRFLYHLVKWRRPYVALEIGVESGMASAYMCEGDWPDTQVIGIDINKAEQWPTNISNHHFIHGDSTDMRTWLKVSTMCQDFGKIGIVYQDSSHHYLASKKEWELYSSLLDKDAIWICDDVTPSFHDPNVDPPRCGMVEYFNELPSDKRTYKDILHFGNIQGILCIP
jgi:cephalosporin hydroxylase